MSKILVIADDLTGAAEIGGIAFKAGFSVRIVLDNWTHKHFLEDVIIIETNTRQLTENLAYEKIISILKQIDLSAYDLIFKKVDSLLRGNITSEIQAIFTQSCMNSALLIPANPTKKRIIKNGKYYINNIPINETNFKFDPEYPRRWKTVKKLISRGNNINISESPLLEKHLGPITIPDITTLKDIEVYAQQNYVENQLVAGSADFFRTLLAIRFDRSFDSIPATIEFLGNILFLIGSNSKVSKQTQLLLSKKNYEIFNLLFPPSALKNSFSNWKYNINSEFQKGKNIVIATPVKFVKTYSRRRQITNMIVEAACHIIQNSNDIFPIMIEGGETASTFFRKMKWCDLNVCADFEDGVVMLVDNRSKRQVTMKPGSYKWPTAILNNI